MHNKTLLSLAIASSIALTGCSDGETSRNDGATTDPNPQTEFAGRTWPIFNVVTQQFPVPNDLLFDSEAGDGSFNLGEPDSPVIAALNNLSGGSTVAPVVVRFNGQIDPDTVNSRAFVPNPQDPTSGIPNPDQNVFLIAVEHPSQEPVRGLLAQEPPTIPAALTLLAAREGAAALEGVEQEVVKNFINYVESGPDLQTQAGAYLANRAQNPRFDHDVIQLDGTSALRIRPNEPLDPLRRYVVVVTNEVLDENRDPISSSPVYARLSENASTGSDALDDVAGLINSFWEVVAAGDRGYFNLTNGVRQQSPDFGEDDLISNEDIALSYSFTTSEDEKVLSHIAEPANWLEDQVRRAVTTEAAATAVQEGAQGFSAVRGAVDQALNDFTPSEDLSEDLAVCDPSPTPFQCVVSALKGVLQQGGITFSAPTARTFSLDSAVPADTLSPLLAQFGGSNVQVHQGKINLPYFLGVPTAQNPAPIRTQSWSVDSGAAAAIADATGFPIPQANPETSTVLNYNFPFPELQAEFDVPLLVMTPDGVSAQDLRDGNCCDQVVMYQHGITADRSAALAFGSSLIAQGLGQGENIAVVAIDQPLHGIDPNGSIFPSGITTTHEGQGVNDGGITERHFGFEADAQGNPSNPQPMNFNAEARGGSGSLFINVFDFLVGRDVQRQGALDLMNVRKTLEEKWDGADASNISIVGHSLGTQTGGVFAGAVQQSGNSDLQLSSVHLLTPVAGVVRLLENSPSFAPRILTLLQAGAGLTQGDANFETFLRVSQHAMDSADPINFADQLAQTNTLIGQINGDRTTPNAAAERFSDSVQNFNTEPLDIDLPTGMQINSSTAPLTGSEALAKVMDANSVERGMPVETPAISRYLEGEHGTTPVIPTGITADQGDILKDRSFAEGGETVVSAANAQAAFGEMVAQTLGLILNPNSPKEVTGGGGGNPGIIQDGN